MKEAESGLSRRHVLAMGGASVGVVLHASRPVFAKSDIQKTFDSVKQINAGVLNIGYAEVGPSKGRVVILLHGWPYDIHSYVEVAPLLASAGYRVIIPYLRGYGTTRFLSNDTFRNGQQSVFAVDVIALMDALNIDKALIAGFDWGERGLQTLWLCFGPNAARRSCP